MQARQNYWFIAQAAFIGLMLAAVDFGLFEALSHMLRWRSGPQGSIGKGSPAA